MGGIVIKKIFFDTETTGLNCRNCQIIELAMITVVDGKIVEEYDEFIKYEKPLPFKITKITGITDGMLENEGLSEKQVASDLRERLSDEALMIAHNAQFDLSFIYSLLKKYYPDEACELLSKMGWLDTLTVLKDRKKYPHKLIDAVRYYEVEEVNFHRAIDDTKALYEVYKELKKERNDLEEYKNVFGYNPKYGRSGFNFKFIKYGEQQFHNCKVPDNMILPNLIPKK